MARNKKHRKGSGKKAYSIIVDGETEVWYFQMMKRHELLPKIDVRPELPKKKKLKEQYEAVKENLEQGYDKVIWLLDFDTLIQEDQARKKGGQSKIQEFKAYKEQLEKRYNTEKITKIYVLVNTPCLEFWHLLHFEETSKFFLKCENAEKELRRKHLKDYKKTERYYKKSDNDIYKRLKPTQDKAILNAKKVGEFSFENPQSAKAEIYKIFEILNISTG